MQPEGLIWENFVQCEPGSPAGRAAGAPGGQAATVPVARTSVPVSLTDLFKIWKVPVRDRVPVVLSSLGGGVAGRGADAERAAAPGEPDARRSSAGAGRPLDRQRARSRAVVRDRPIPRHRRARACERGAALIRDGVAVDAPDRAQSASWPRASRGCPALLDATRPRRAPGRDRRGAGARCSLTCAAAAPRLERLITEFAPFAKTARPR